MNKLASAKSLCENYITKVAMTEQEKKGLRNLQRTEGARAALTAASALPLLGASIGLGHSEYVPYVLAPAAGVSLGGYVGEKIADYSKLGLKGHMAASTLGGITGGAVASAPLLMH